MDSLYSSVVRKSNDTCRRPSGWNAKAASTSIAPNRCAAELCAEVAVNHLRRIGKLDDLAFALLCGADGDQVEAEKSLEDHRSSIRGWRPLDVALSDRARKIREGV